MRNAAWVELSINYQEDVGHYLPLSLNHISLLIAKLPL